MDNTNNTIIKKPIECTDEKDEATIYISIYSASHTLNINPGIIKYALDHNKKVIRGEKKYQFKYLEVEPVEPNPQDEIEQKKGKKKEIDSDIMKLVRKIRVYVTQYDGISCKNDINKYAMACYERCKTLDDRHKIEVFEYFYKFFNRYRIYDAKEMEDMKNKIFPNF